MRLTIGKRPSSQIARRHRYKSYPGLNTFLSGLVNKRIGAALNDQLMTAYLVETSLPIKGGAIVDFEQVKGAGYTLIVAFAAMLGGLPAEARPSYEAPLVLIAIRKSAVMQNGSK